VAPVAPVTIESPATMTTEPNDEKAEANEKQISAKTNDSSPQQSQDIKHKRGESRVRLRPCLILCTLGPRSETNEALNAG
jgi:hypothetical protein